MLERRPWLASDIWEAFFMWQELGFDLVIMVPGASHKSHLVCEPAHCAYNVCVNCLACIILPSQFPKLSEDPTNQVNCMHTQMHDLMMRIICDSHGAKHA